jgi:putative endonuclease
MHYVYIIYSEAYDVYYKGESAEPYVRLDYHNKGMSRYTKGKGPWILVYLEEFPNRSAALAREKNAETAKSQLPTLAYFST